MQHEAILYLIRHDTVVAQIIALAGVLITNVVAVCNLLENRNKATREKLSQHSEELSQIVADNSLRDGVNIHAVNEAILEAANVAIILCDEDSKVFQWNDAASALFGWTEHEARYRLITFIMPHAMRARHLAGFAQYQETGQAKIIGRTVGLEALHKNGTIFPISLTLSAGEMVDGKKFYCGVIAPLATLAGHESEHEAETTPPPQEAREA